MEMLNKRWYHIHSHQHCPSSVLPRLCCPSRESVSVYKLYSRPPCIVLNLCFWFRPGISHSLGFDPVTGVPPARASRCSSACQQLEQGAVTKLVPPLLTAASIYHALRSSCAERDSNFNLHRQNEAVLSDGRDSRGLSETCERRDWRIRDPTWRKRDPTWRNSNESWRKSELCWRKKIYS